MKKLLLSLIISAVSLSVNLPVLSNEIEEDYLDIASNYCVLGDYNSAIEYLDKILTINPNNQQVITLCISCILLSR